MENFKYQHKAEQRQQQKEQPTDSSGPKEYKCPSCGSEYEPGDAFCSECGEPLNGGCRNRQEAEHAREFQKSSGSTCPHCRKAINSTYELCPHCGKPLRVDYCIFCGTPFEGSERFCMECGSDRNGIKCPRCGTLSSRSFCSHCNEPLNDNAREALEAAKRDPKFQRATQLQQEMQSMEAYLQAFAEEIEKAIAEAELEGDAPETPGLSKEGEALHAKYAELMSLLGQKQVARPSAKPAGPKPSVKRREQLKLKFVDADRIMEAYKAKAAEMQATLSSMMPDPSMTPQQQRDYACARKVATVTTRQVRQPSFWECNYCHCYHNQPSECCEPQLGGVWHYETITIKDKVWNYVK